MVLCIICSRKGYGFNVKIELMENDIIKIRLTRADLEQLNISMEELACTDAQTRRIIGILLDAARCELNAYIAPPEHMLIEVMPNRNGGCCIYLTGLEGCAEIMPKYSAGKNMKPQFFDFDCADSLMSAASALRPLIGSESQLSELYRMGADVYRLLVYPDSEVSARVRAVLSQYCAKHGSGSTAVAFTREHGRLIAGGDAIGKLTAHYIN